MEKINYYLVLEKRLGDNILIDINKLDICTEFVTNDIGNIDAFTARFSEEEIKASITRSNMAVSSYLDGKLKIISDAKHNLKVLTKDIYQRITKFQYSTEDINQDIKNKLFGSFKKVIENNFTDKDFIKGLLEKFKSALKFNNRYEIFKMIEELPYSKARNIYFGIYEEELKRENANLRNLKKINDGA